MFFYCQVRLMTLNYQQRDVDGNPIKLPLLHGDDTKLDIQLTISWVRSWCETANQKWARHIFFIAREIACRTTPGLLLFFPTALTP